MGGARLCLMQKRNKRELKLEFNKNKAHQCPLFVLFVTCSFDLNIQATHRFFAMEIPELGRSF